MGMIEPTQKCSFTTLAQRYSYKIETVGFRAMLIELTPDWIAGQLD